MALGHQPEDLLLARGQPFQLGLKGASLGEQRGDGARRDEDLPAGDVPDRRHHLGRGPRLVQKRAGARLHGGEPRPLGVLARQEDHLRRRTHTSDRRGRVRTSAVGQVEVEQHDVGVELGRRGHALGDGAYVPDDLHVGLVVDERGQALRHDAVILDDQDAGRLVLAIVSRRLRRRCMFGGGHIALTHPNAAVLTKSGPERVQKNQRAGTGRPCSSCAYRD